MVCIKVEAKLNKAMLEITQGYQSRFVGFEVREYFDQIQVWVLL